MVRTEQVEEQVEVENEGLEISQRSLIARLKAYVSRDATFTRKLNEEGERNESMLTSTGNMAFLMPYE